MYNTKNYPPEEWLTRKDGEVTGSREMRPSRRWKWDERAEKDDEEGDDSGGRLSGEATSMRTHEERGGRQVYAGRRSEREETEGGGNARGRRLLDDELVHESLFSPSILESTTRLILKYFETRGKRNVW